VLKTILIFFPREHNNNNKSADGDHDDDRQGCIHYIQCGNPQDKGYPLNN